MVRGVLLVSFAGSFGIATAFLRGVVLARILGTEQFGVAVILISIVAALDMFADAGIDKFVVGSRFGYRPDLMRTSHAYRVIGSTVIALAILALSRPLGLLFGSADLWLPIAATGGVVWLRGFVNLDYKLQQRERRFGKEATIDLARYAADIATIVGVALITESFWAVIAASYANALVQLVMSHLYARGRYSFRPRGRLVKLVGRFSVPIYINAAILLAAVQGDRFVVAAMFTKHELALYAVACAIGQGLAAVVNRVTTSTLLPVFAAHGAPHAEKRRRPKRGGLAASRGSLFFLGGMALLGPIAVRLIYGPEYTGLQAIIMASAIVQMIQIEQGWLSTLLMANGLTASFPRITIMRAAAFPVAIGLVALGMSLIAIPLAFAFGATLSLIASYWAARPLRLVARRLFAASMARILLSVAAIPLLF